MASYLKRKNKDGSLSHQFRIRRKGFPLITRTFKRKVDGEAWVVDTLAALRAGSYLCPKKSEMTLAELIEHYLESHSFLRRRSKHSPSQTLSWWKEQLGSYFIKNITKQLVKQFWLKLGETPSVRTGKPLTNRTMNSYLESLSACLSYAVEEELIEANPVLKIKKRTLNNSRERTLSEEELKALLQAATKSSNRYLLTAILISLSTGGRRGEVMGLTWNDVDLKTGKVRFRITKNGKPRVVVLGASALSALREQSRLRVLNSDLIFAPLKTRRGGKSNIPWEDLRAPFRRACKEAGIEDFRWHDLRHCAASFLIMSGASIEEAMKVLGHRSAAMSWRYAHLNNRRTAELAEKVDNTFLINTNGFT